MNSLMSIHLTPIAAFQTAVAELFWMLIGHWISNDVVDCRVILGWKKTIAKVNPKVMDEVSLEGFRVRQTVTKEHVLI